MVSRDVFIDLIKRHGDKAYNFAYSLAGNEQDARDLVQEAFVRAFEARDRYDSGRPFDSWLVRILRNIHFDWISRYEHQHGVSLSAPPPAGEEGWEEILPGKDPDPLRELLRREAGSAFQAALQSLPPHYKAAVALADIEGLSYEATARVLSCPVGTVRSRVHQGRVLLRRGLEPLLKEEDSHGPS